MSSSLGKQLIHKAADPYDVWWPLLSGSRLPWRNHTETGLVFSAARSIPGGGGGILSQERPLGVMDQGTPVLSCGRFTGWRYGNLTFV